MEGNSWASITVKRLGGFGITVNVPGMYAFTEERMLSSYPDIIFANTCSYKMYCKQSPMKMNLIRLIIIYLEKNISSCKKHLPS